MSKTSCGCTHIAGVRSELILAMDGRIRLSKYNLGSARSPSREFPIYTIHLVGRFLRLISVYIVHGYLLLPGASVVTFTFVCLLTATIFFLILHRPWKGRPLSTTELVPTLVNGAVLALSYVLWGKALRDCGPVRTVMGEYVGAFVGAASTLVFGRGGGKWKKVGGLMAMSASYFFLSQGWAMASYSPFSFRNGEVAQSSVSKKGPIGISSMSLPIFAGILAALSRVIARRVSLKTQLKRRLHVVSVTAATWLLFPFAVFQSAQMKDGVRIDDHLLLLWPFVSNTVFGILMIFYVDLISEERLHIVVASPKHLLVTSCCIIVLEILNKMDFSVLGFVICTSLLGLGIFESTSLERIKRGSTQLPTQMNEITQSNDSLIMSPVLDHGSGVH